MAGQSGPYFARIHLDRAAVHGPGDLVADLEVVCMGIKTYMDKASDSARMGQDPALGCCVVGASFASITLV